MEGKLPNPGRARISVPRCSTSSTHVYRMTSRIIGSSASPQASRCDISYTTGMRTFILTTAAPELFATLVPQVTVIEAERTTSGLVLTAVSQSAKAPCPCCKALSTRVHSYRSRAHASTTPLSRAPRAKLSRGARCPAACRCFSPAGAETSSRVIGALDRHHEGKRPPGTGGVRQRPHTRSCSCGSSVTITWSNGMTEGHVYRLKMIKRTAWVCQLHVASPARLGSGGTTKT